jgi:hypothetical protein
MTKKEFSITDEQVRSVIELIRQADEGKRMYRVTAHLIGDIIAQVQLEPRAPIGSVSGMCCAVCHKEHTSGYMVCEVCLSDIEHRAERYNSSCQACIDGYSIQCCKKGLPCKWLTPGKAQPDPAHWKDYLCPKHSFCRVNNGDPAAIMHFCDGVELSRHFRDVHEGTLVQELRDAVKSRSFHDSDGDFHEVGLTPEEIEDCISKSHLPRDISKEPVWLSRVIALISEEEQKRIAADAIKSVCEKIIEYDEGQPPNCKDLPCSADDIPYPCLKCIIEQATAEVLGEQKK